MCCCLISYSSLTTFMNGSQGEKIKVLASVLIDETLKVSQLSCALWSCPQAMRVKEAVFRWPLCRHVLMLDMKELKSFGPVQEGPSLYFTNCLSAYLVLACPPSNPIIKKIQLSKCPAGDIYFQNAILQCYFTIQIILRVQRGVIQYDFLSWFHFCLILVRTSFGTISFIQYFLM